MCYDKLSLEEEFRDSILIIEKYLNKRAMLGINYESFGICIDTLNNKSQYGKIALMKINNTNIEKYKVPDFVDTVGFYIDSPYIVYGDKNYITNNTIVGKKHELKEITLGKSVETIAFGAFSESNIESVKINGYIKEIDTRAFEDCKKLSEFDFDKLNNTCINNNAFKECKNLNKADLSCVKYIGKYAFFGCSNLTEVLFGDSLEILNGNCFNYCNLMKIIVPDNVTHIHDYAFGNNKNIESIRLGKKLEYLDANFMQGSYMKNTNIEINSDLKKLNSNNIASFKSYYITLICSKGNAEFLDWKYNLTCKIKIK